MAQRLTYAALLLSAFAFTACSDPAQLGEPCADTADCADDLRCFERRGAEVTQVCMAGCDADTVRICTDGSACIGAVDSDMVPLDEDVCYLGGPVALGELCTGTLDCAAGGLCIDTGTEQRCFQACFTDDAAGCPTGETCAPLQMMGNKGFCQATM